MEQVSPGAKLVYGADFPKRRHRPSVNPAGMARSRRRRHVFATQRCWRVSTDKESAAKAAEVVGLYLNRPEKALVMLDE